MIDHIGLTVSDYPAAKAFYTAALAPINFTLMQKIPASITGDVDVAGFGDERPEFWINGSQQTTPHLHIAFRVATPEMVDGFYRAALQAGGRDNGAPGLRDIYGPGYYAAFVRDLDGHNIEAVCFLEE